MHRAKVINNGGKFIVIRDTIDLKDPYNKWLINSGIYDLVSNDVDPQYENGIRWFERKQGVPDSKTYKIKDMLFHIDFSYIKANNS